MRTALVLIGDELLNGAVRDSATTWIGHQLADHGFELSHVQVVGDDLAAISDAILMAVARGDAVIVSGGLGPTSDDLTREGLARAAGVRLERSPEVLALIHQRYLARGRPLPDNAGVMAGLPFGAHALANQEGSAPGISMELDAVPIFALPGVPREMQAMFTHEVLPKLLHTFAQEPLTTMVLRIAIEGESAVAQRLVEWEAALPAQVKVAYLAQLGDVLVKVTGADKALVQRQAILAADLLGESVYAMQEKTAPAITLAALVHASLRQRGETIATAESLTGGGVGVALTAISGSSTSFRGGIIAYSPELKSSLLEVPTSLIGEVGTVHPQVAYEMAVGAHRATGADWVISTTGVAGPGESEGQAAGTVYLAITGPKLGTTVSDYLRVIRVDLPLLDRDLVRRATVIHALDLARRTLSGLGNTPGVQDVTHLCRII